jgi:hypothetical protein
MNKGLSIVGSSRANGEREENDFYPTPTFATEELLKREKFDGAIWECACGDGAARLKVRFPDLKDRLEPRPVEKEPKEGEKFYID